MKTKALNATLTFDATAKFIKHNTDPTLVAMRKFAMRNILGLTQRDLAKRLRCSQPMVSGMLNGTERSRRLEIRFADMTETSWAHLFRPFRTGLDIRAGKTGLQRAPGGAGDGPTHT